MQKTLQINRTSFKSKVFSKIFFVVVLGVGFSQSSFAQGSVGIGTQTPSASAALDVFSTTKGLLVPRLTILQRDAIAAPAVGLLIYNTEALTFNYWNGTVWKAVGNGVDWYTGQGVPPGSANPGTDIGKLNDLYLDITTTDIYQKELSSLNPLVLSWKRLIVGNKVVKIEINAPTFTIPANSYLKQTFSFAGAIVGNAVTFSPKLELTDGLNVTYSRVSAADVVEVKFHNSTAVPIVVTAQDFEIAIIK